ncbi:MAG TPA: hypothetical protein VGL93_05505 [Streptosporangiaceae bacterium]|jgi:hypothetical protein
MIIIVALLATVFLPFVNRSTLWFGIPPVMLWSAVGVVLLSPALGLVEYARHRRGETDPEDAEQGEVSGE